MLKLFWLAIFLLPLCIFAEEADLTLQAKQEKWSFKYEPNPKEYRTGLIKYPTGLKKNVLKSYDNLLKADIPIPETYDLRDKISPIRDQGNCGSCWAFSLTATLRDAFMLFNNDPGALSEQYLVDCATDMYGCNGGLPDAAIWHVIPKGAPLLVDYPYTARNGKCQSKNVAASSLEWHYIGSTTREPTTDEIQKAILEYGPVAITVGADRSFMAYRSGVYNACHNTQINHMTNIVGWNNKEQYWIMRNSWGTKWGEAGYMRIKFEDTRGNKCNNIANEAVYYKVDNKPVPPTPKEFVMEGANLKLKVTIKADAKYKVEDAKKVIQPFIDNLDRR